MSSLYSAIIAGTGSQLPEKRLTNDDLSKMVETNDEWIVQRTGIRERRIAGAERNHRDAWQPPPRRKAMTAAGIEAERYRADRLSPRSRRRWCFPSTACFVAAALGMNGDAGV